DLPLRPSLICRSTVLIRAFRRLSVARPFSLTWATVSLIEAILSPKEPISRSWISAIDSKAPIPSSVRPPAFIESTLGFLLSISQRIDFGRRLRLLVQDEPHCFLHLFACHNFLLRRQACG